MKHLSVIGMIIGLFVLTLLVVLQGAAEIFSLLAKTGWVLLTLTLIWVPCLYFYTESWRLVFRREAKPPFWFSLAAIWMGRSINSLLPVATIGGEIAKARMITFTGVSGIDATATMLVDKTVQVLAIIVWGLIGLGTLIYLKDDDTFAMTAMAGFGLLALGVFGFFLVQRAGMFNILTIIGSALVKSEKWDGISCNAKAVDETVMIIYRRQLRFWWSVVLKSLGLVVQTGEVWLACYLLGFPIGIIEAMIIKSLTSTLSDVAFVIPNAYGIQEGAYIVVGAMFGLAPDFALAVSLATRVRELIIDVPGLLYWQLYESKLLLKKQAAIK
jgi:putative membrane protein